jgi:hypothetical protein
VRSLCEAERLKDIDVPTACSRREVRFISESGHTCDQKQKKEAYQRPSTQLHSLRGRIKAVEDTDQTVASFYHQQGIFWNVGTHNFKRLLKL